MAFTVRSSAFADGAGIPRRYTCSGIGVSPPLEWSEAPRDTQSFALIVVDPDAPRRTWVHWLLYDAPATITSLHEGVPRAHTVAGGVRQGRNDFGRIGYGGPCPPAGPAHRYFFHLYALDALPRLAPAADRQTLESAMHGHVLAEAVLMGRYAI